MDATAPPVPCTARLRGPTTLHQSPVSGHCFTFYQAGITRSLATPCARTRRRRHGCRPFTPLLFCRNCYFAAPSQCRCGEEPKCLCCCLAFLISIIILPQICRLCHLAILYYSQLLLCASSSYRTPFVVAAPNPEGALPITIWEEGVDGVTSNKDTPLEHGHTFRGTL